MSDYLKSAIEACAKAGHEALRQDAVSRGEEPGPEWDALSPEDQGGVMSSAASVLRGEGPAADYDAWAYEQRAAGVDAPKYRDLGPERHRRDDVFLRAVAAASFEACRSTE